MFERELGEKALEGVCTTMFKILTHSTDGRRVALLGLSDQSVERLLADEPIHVDLAAPPPEGLGLKGAPIVAIFAGRTESQVMEEINQATAGVDIKSMRDR